MTDVLIIGGGAAGMMAALTAAERGYSVLLLERQSRVGRKLLATGNGRCNLTNHRVSPEHYHGDESSFCGHALRAFDVGTTLQYFASLGLLTVQEDSGRVYPMSNMAGSVLDVLRYALERPGIQVRTGQASPSERRRTPSPPNGSSWPPAAPPAARWAASWTAIAWPRAWATTARSSIPRWCR